MRYTVYSVQCLVHVINMQPEIIENLRLELRRGCLILAVLAELRVERYGYVLKKVLSEAGLVIDENTLYPLSTPPGEPGTT